MDDKLDLEERQPEPSPETPPQAPAKLTADEARRKYGLRCLILLGLFCWFAYDGWLNQDPKMLEHVGFNRIGAILLGLGLAYSLIMFASAARTVAREKRQPPAQ